jgi:hypothetical protein
MLQVLEGLQWIYRLYESAATTLHSPEAASRLALFWKWLHKKLLDGCLGNLRYSNSEMIVGFNDEKFS